MTEVEQLVLEYFSSLGPLARKVMQDQELVRSMYGAEWEQMSYEQRDAVIDEYVIKAEILEHYKDYSRWEEPPEYFPKLKLGSGEKIIVDDDFRTWQDEHSGPFCWETKSQLDMPLFETDEDREKAAKARKRRPRSPDLKKINFNPFKQGKSIWDSPFLAADRGRDSGYPMDVSELGKTPEEMEQETADMADSANYEECGGESPNYEECAEASPDSGLNDGSPVDQVMASPEKTSVAEEAEYLFKKFHISFSSNDDGSNVGNKKKTESPPEPFGDTESSKKSEESSPNYSPVGSPVFSRDSKPLVKMSPKLVVKTNQKPTNTPSKPLANTPSKTSIPTKKPPPVPLSTKPKPKSKYEPECDDSYEFVEVNRNNNFMVSNLSSTENSPIRSVKKDETTALLHSSCTSTDTKSTKGSKPVRKKHDSSSSNSSSAALLADDSPFKMAVSNAVVTTQPTPFYDEYEPHGPIDNKKDDPAATGNSSVKTGFDFLDNW